ncbi:MAG TPA: CinA family nicotinamide mononucleotide deamidase-related protein [Opitutaceae bacterium]|nr:CinA family nicotinamide mononucleotide deamidase-related protein [Opitutaceae bacterium]
MKKSPHKLRYELLTIGDELLLGLTANGHLTFIGAQLGARGIELRRNVTVTDDAEDISSQVRESWARSDVVLITGGLGPTCDDRTREAVATVLEQNLVFDKNIERHILERFALFGRKMTPNNLKQAYRFERGEVLPNSNGTAPGLWVEQEGKVLCMMPGPPNELQPMFTEQVLPRLAKLGLVLDREAYVQLRTAGIGESLLETKLQPVFDRHGPALGVAFCAHSGHVDCRLSSPGGELEFAQLATIATECIQLLGDDFVTLGDDSLSKVCADLLRSQEKMLAVAETATGGLLANAFTDVCGASKFFSGGCVCYSNDSKMQLLDIPECLLLQHGAVSAEAAVAMATGASEKLGADYALAITGFTGPCGGTNENPVGTMFVALHAPHGVWSRKVSYPGPRTTVKQRAVNAALDWLRRELVRASQGATVPAKHHGVMQ